MSIRLVLFAIGPSVWIIVRKALIYLPPATNICLGNSPALSGLHRSKVDPLIDDIWS
jgi:hypothetical protein